MRSDIDYRLPENRFTGMDKFFDYMRITGDYSPDITVETWICDKYDFSFEKRCSLGLFHGATYAGPCETLFSEKFPVVGDDPSEMIEFFRKNSKRLNFSQDCRYRKHFFEGFLTSVSESVKPYGGTLGGLVKSCFTSSDPQENYKNLYDKCTSKWVQWSRMGNWCFAEAMVKFVKAPIEPPTMEFRGGKSHRAGWAFALGLDRLTGREASPADCQMLEDEAAKYIKSKGLSNVDFFSLETCCCNYKRNFEGSRYAGCYIDEQHDEILTTKMLWPEYDYLWDRYLEGRQAVIPKKLLFENFHTEGHAHNKSWNRALKDHGRLYALESWYNDTPRYWGDMDNLSPTTTNIFTIK